MIRLILAAGIAATISDAALANATISKGARIALVVTTSELTAPARLAVDDLSTYLQRTLRAAVRRFLVAHPELIRLDSADPRMRFAIRYETDIPRQVGL